MNATPSSFDFDDRSVRIIAAGVPGVKNTSEGDKILATVHIYGVAALVDENRRLVKTVKSVSGLESWEEGRPLSLPDTATIGEARRLFEESGETLIPLVSKRGRYRNICASRELLAELDAGCLRPQRVGGLATPLGVYMTTGQHTGGAGLMGMFAMGAVFGLASVSLEWLFPVFYSAMVALVPQARFLPVTGPETLQIGFMIVSILALMQFTPLSALHAAEHMTIYAMESDLDIEEHTVRRQPRAHPRCGTNLAVIMTGLSIALMSLSVLWARMTWVGWTLYGLLWGYLIHRYWHRVGLWIQWNFTTRKPNAAELESGLKAGKEVSARFSAAPHAHPPIWKRLWMMGIVQLLGGFIATATIFQAVVIFGINGGKMPENWWWMLF